MRTHDEVVARLMRRPGVRKEVERIEREEGALLDILLKARQEAGLSQAQVAERMGTQAPAIARLERALATGKHSPSLATLRKYAHACGKKLSLHCHSAARRNRVTSRRSTALPASGWRRFVLGHDQDEAPAQRCQDVHDLPEADFRRITLDLADARLAKAQSAAELGLGE